VYVERHGRLELTGVRFYDNAHLLQIVQRVAARVGRRADEMSPMVDARLEDGSRVNAIIPPLALTGPVLSIRRFGVRLGSDELLTNGTMPPEVLALLRAAVEARISILVSGGTGSGKTTLLNALSAFIPGEERLITIEDSAELRLRQSHVVSLETRVASVEGSGEIRQRELVRNALRMRPDRIIVGEVRGGEALDMLQAMNTGHEGSLTTIHANDARDSLTRMEMMVMMAGFELPVPVIRYYIANAITLVVQLARLKGGRRKVVQVSEVLGTDPSPYDLRDVFGYRQRGVRNGQATGEFYATGHRPRLLGKLRAMGIELPDELFRERVWATE
jgi:pilus assembly protein CpaF